MYKFFVTLQTPTCLRFHPLSVPTKQNSTEYNSKEYKTKQRAQTKKQTNKRNTHTQSNQPHQQKHTQKQKQTKQKQTKHKQTCSSSLKLLRIPSSWMLAICFTVFLNPLYMLENVIKKMLESKNILTLQIAFV